MSGCESAVAEGRFVSPAGWRAMALASAALVRRDCSRRSRQEKKHIVPTAVLIPRAKKLVRQESADTEDILEPAEAATSRLYMSEAWSELRGEKMDHLHSEPYTSRAEGVIKNHTDSIALGACPAE